MSLAEVCLKQANFLFLSGKHDAGKKVLATALKNVMSDPRPKQLITDAIDLLRTYGFRQDTESLEKTALSFFPDDLIFNMLRINSLTAQHRYDEALPLVQVARKKFPHDAKLAHRHGTILLHTGRTKEAEKVGQHTVDRAKLWV